jgi:hypothetical protein
MNRYLKKKRFITYLYNICDMLLVLSYNLCFFSPADIRQILYLIFQITYLTLMYITNHTIQDPIHRVVFKKQHPEISNRFFFLFVNVLDYLILYFKDITKRKSIYHRVKPTYR